MALLAIIAIAFSFALCWIASIANARFSSDNRLPMQWWIDGKVTWDAPRHFALAFVPVLGTSVLALFILMNFTMKIRPGDEHLVIPILIVVGCIFVAVQLLHLYLVARSLRR